MTELLFSYGTLRSTQVQLASFGRILNGEQDCLNRYRITKVEITDADVLAKSGERYHPAAIPSGDEKDKIEGMVFEISPEELALADAYEVDDYIRTSVRLASGKKAWMYILKTYALQTRRAEQADAKILSDLICETAHALLRPHYTEQQWAIFIKYYSEQVLKEKIAKQVVFCAVQGDVILGTAALDGNFVVGFYTRLQYINQGIGKFIMSSLESYAESQGLSELQLAASPEGLSFYYKNGWEKVKDFTVEHYGVGFDETLMTKKLQH
ncbi:GNAT family N-acetyltransferase [Mucilaginibacter sp. HD30]